MNKKATDIVSYFGIIGWAIAYFFGDKENCKYHLNQALVLAVLEILLGILNRAFKGFLFSGLLGIIGLALLAAWIIGMISAIKGTQIHIPFISDVKIL